MFRFLSIPLLLATLATPSFALDAGEMFADPAQEARAREIGRQLRCLKCRNQSIFDSNAGLAHDLRVLVRERMQAGDSDQQILDYVHDRYGDFVLLKPPVTANTYALWATPVLMVLLALGGAGYYLKRRPAPQGARELNDEEQRQARALLQGDQP